MITVSIVEDNHDIREGLALLIDGTPNFSCAGAYPDCETALKKLSMHLPDVLLLDIELPGISGVQALPKLKKLLPETDILMLTVHEEEQLVFQSLCAGACGYLLKTTPPIKLIKAIEEVRRGGAPMSTHIARKVIHSFQLPVAKVQLTAREKEVLTLLCEGHSYKMIANQLGISKGTVHCHIKNIYHKLQVNTNVEAVAKALKEHLV